MPFSGHLTIHRGDFVLTIAEVAERLRVSLACAYGLVENGKLSCFRIGLGRGTIRVSEEQLEAYLTRSEKRGTSGGTPVPVKLKHITL